MIGLKKSMVFYKGKAPAGRKTKWKMNEYRAIEHVADPSSGDFPMVSFTKCFDAKLLFKKSSHPSPASNMRNSLLIN